MKRIRKTFLCWNCDKEYTLSRRFTVDSEDDHAIQEVEGALKLWVECPFCYSEAVVDLNPQASTDVAVYRDDSKPMPISSFNLPDVIPTRKK